MALCSYESSARLMLRLARENGLTLELDFIRSLYSYSPRPGVTVAAELRSYTITSCERGTSSHDAQQLMRRDVAKLSQVTVHILCLRVYFTEISDPAQQILNFIRANYRDPAVLKWLDEQREDLDFLNLLSFFYRAFKMRYFEKLRADRGHVDILFVAHGRLSGNFIPAAGLLPKPSIEDTVLYSPWNCNIDAHAAYGIAEDCIRPQNRQFGPVSVPYKPIPLPDRWNNMSRSNYPNVPEIILSPVSNTESVWKDFTRLLRGDDLCQVDRIIIPYLCEERDKPDLPEVPFHVLNFALSFILSHLGRRATVHLAACLGRGGSPLQTRKWLQQYAYTVDDTYMSAEGLPITNQRLFSAFSQMFGV